MDRGYLFYFHNLDRTTATEHQDRHTPIAKLADELPAHAAGARVLVEIGGHGDGLDHAGPVALGHRPADGHALGAGPDRVGGVFDVGARYDGAVELRGELGRIPALDKDGASDSEL
jgi:hypothetical protein